MLKNNTGLSDLCGKVTAEAFLNSVAPGYTAVLTVMITVLCLCCFDSFNPFKEGHKN